MQTFVVEGDEMVVPRARHDRTDETHSRLGIVADALLLLDQINRVGLWRLVIHSEVIEQSAPSVRKPFPR